MVSSSSKTPRRTAARKSAPSSAEKHTSAQLTAPGASPNPLEFLLPTTTATTRTSGSARFKSTSAGSVKHSSSAPTIAGFADRNPTSQDISGPRLPTTNGSNKRKVNWDSPLNTDTETYSDFDKYHQRKITQGEPEIQGFHGASTVMGDNHVHHRGDTRGRAVMPKLEAVDRKASNSQKAQAAATATRFGAGVGTAKGFSFDVGSVEESEVKMMMADAEGGEEEEEIATATTIATQNMTGGVGGGNGPAVASWDDFDRVFHAMAASEAEKKISGDGEGGQRDAEDEEEVVEKMDESV